MRSQVEVFDEGGTLLCTNRCTTLFPTLGGYGGQPMPRGASPIPERDPDTPVQLHLWKLEEGKAAFRFVNAQTGKAILDRGELEWQ